MPGVQTQVLLPALSPLSFSSPPFPFSLLGFLAVMFFVDQNRCVCFSVGMLVGPFPTGSAAPRTQGIEFLNPAVGGHSTWGVFCTLLTLTYIFQHCVYYLLEFWWFCSLEEYFSSRLVVVLLLLEAVHTLYHIHGQVCTICLANPVFATLCSVWLNKYLLSCSQIQFWGGFFFCFKIQKVSLNSGSLYSLRRFLNSLSHKWCCSSGLCNCKRKKSQLIPYTQHRNQLQAWPCVTQ